METTCLEGPHVSGRRFRISMQLNPSPRITCLEIPCIYGQCGSLSRQVLLYKTIRGIFLIAHYNRMHNRQGVWYVETCAHVFL